MKWVNFLSSAKNFFSLVELSTKKAIRILLSKLLPCALAPGRWFNHARFHEMIENYDGVEMHLVLCLQ